MLPLLYMIITKCELMHQFVCNMLVFLLVFCFGVIYVKASYGIYYLIIINTTEHFNNQ